MVDVVVHPRNAATGLVRPNRFVWARGYNKTLGQPGTLAENC